jgi:hypothetical protein
MEDDDLSALRPDKGVKLSVLTQGFCAFVMLILALQTSQIFLVRGIVAVVMPLMFLLAGALALSTLLTAKMRFVGALIGVVAAGSVAFLGAGWFIFSLLNSAISLLGLLVVPLGAIACGLSLGALPEIKKATALRARMREEGLDAGM